MRGLLEEELKRFDSVFIILDGHDEVHKEADRATIVEAIHGYGPRVKVMITSRHLGDIKETLEAAQECKE